MKSLVNLLGILLVSTLFLSHTKSNYKANLVKKNSKNILSTNDKAIISTSKIISDMRTPIIIVKKD